MFNLKTSMPKASLEPITSDGKKSDTDESSLIIRTYENKENTDKSIDSMIYKVFINGVIKEPRIYVKLICKLLNASKYDKFDIYFKSPGGSVMSGYMILNAMQTSKAHINTVAYGVIASVASTLWSFGDTVGLAPWATIMYHMSTHGDYGRSKQIAERATDMVGYIEFVTRRIMDRGLITAEEYKRLVEDKADVFILYNDMYPRLEKANAVPREQFLSMIEKEKSVEPVAQPPVQQPEGGVQ